MNPSPADDRNASAYLASERTFLAWLRTCIAVLSLGFVIAKFNVWLRELALRIDPQVKMHRTGTSLYIGVAMMALGSGLAVLSAWHYHATNLAIERGDLRGSRPLVGLAAAVVALLGVAMIAYMLLTANEL